MSRPDSLFEMAYTARDPHKNRRGNLRFPLQLEMRPSSIAPNPVEYREAPPNSTVFLTSHRHPEKLPRLPSQVEGTQGFLSKLEKDLEIHLQCVLRPNSTVVTREQCRVLHHNSNGDWISLGPHERLAEFPSITQEKHHIRATVREKQQASPIFAR